MRKGKKGQANMTRQMRESVMFRQDPESDRTRLSEICPLGSVAVTRELRSSAVRVASHPGVLFIISSKCQQLSTVIKLVRALYPGASQREKERGRGCRDTMLGDTTHLLPSGWPGRPERPAESRQLLLPLKPLSLVSPSLSGEQHRQKKQLVK